MAQYLYSPYTPSRRVQGHLYICVLRALQTRSLCSATRLTNHQHRNTQNERGSSLLQCGSRRGAKEGLENKLPAAYWCNDRCAHPGDHTLAEMSPVKKKCLIEGKTSLKRDHQTNNTVSAQTLRNDGCGSDKPSALMQSFASLKSRFTLPHIKRDPLSKPFKSLTAKHDVEKCKGGEICTFQYPNKFAGWWWNWLKVTTR